MSGYREPPGPPVEYEHEALVRAMNAVSAAYRAAHPMQPYGPSFAPPEEFPPLGAQPQQP